MTTFLMHEMVFQHLVEMPNVEGIFASAKERSTGRTKLFLFFENNKKVYMRNGIKGTWEEVEEQSNPRLVEDFVNDMINGQKIPFYRYEGSAGYDQVK